MPKPFPSRPYLAGLPATTFGTFPVSPPERDVLSHLPSPPPRLSELPARPPRGHRRSWSSGRPAWTGRGGHGTLVLDAKEVPTSGAFSFKAPGLERGAGVWGGVRRRIYICNEAGCSGAVFPCGGRGRGPVLTFIVASEDPASLSNRRSPASRSRVTRLLLVPAPSLGVGGWEGINIPKLVLDNFEPLTLILFPPL